MVIMVIFFLVYYVYENLFICFVLSDIFDNDLQYLWSLMNFYFLNFEEEFFFGFLDLFILFDILDENGSFVDLLYNLQIVFGV